MATIRISSDKTKHRTVVEYLPDDGPAVNISDAVCSVKWEIDAHGGVGRATLHVVPVEIFVEGVLHEITADMVEVTTIGARVRRWIRGER